jgi:hypothetical protein
MDMQFGRCNVRSLSRAGSLMTTVNEASKYKLDSVGVQDMKWHKCGTIMAGEYTFDKFTIYHRKMLLGYRAPQAIRDIQTADLSKLGWLIRLVKKATCCFDCICLFVGVSLCSVLCSAF